MLKPESRNKKIIAVTGKGGAGKTALTAMMTKILMERRGDLRLLLVDGDPAMGLPVALGVEAGKTIGEAREKVIGAARQGRKQGDTDIAGMLDFLILEALVEMQGFSLLAMGRTETLGCYCPVNDLLRAAIESLSRSFDVILIDGEAGLEQINRQVVRGVDNLIVVTDATLRGIQTAALISRAIKEHDVLPHGEAGLVLNKTRGDEAPILRAAGETGLKILGSIPLDENIAEYDLTGRPITELPSGSPAVIAAGRILDAIFQD